MADPRAIHEFLTGEVEATTLLLGDFVDLDAQSGYTTYKASVSDIGEVILEDIEYTQDLQTSDKTIIGAINENKSVIGYSYDEYDPTTAYSTGDLCIYNNSLYKAKQATTGNLPTNTTYWEQTSIADEINELNTEKQNISLSTVTWEHNNKLVNYGVNFIKSGKFLLIMGVFRGVTITAGETVFTIKDENISSLSDGNNFLQIVGNFSSNYLGYLKATNLNDDIEIKTDVNLDNPSLIFINGILPLN